MISLEEIQEGFLADLEDNLVQPVYETAIPDHVSVLRNDHGDIEPYVSIQFGDTQPGRVTSFVGPWGDDYEIPIYMQTIAPTPRIARKMANKIVEFMLGADFEWSGQVRKRAGGSMFPLVGSNGATQAYMYPLSFKLLMQMAVTA